jgi:hypothetical protein
MIANLADIDSLGMGRSQIQKLKGDQMIIEDDIGLTQNMGPFLGQKARVARAGAHKIDPGQIPGKPPGGGIV